MIAWSVPNLYILYNSKNNVDTYYIDVHPYGLLLTISKTLFIQVDVLNISYITELDIFKNGSFVTVSTVYIFNKNYNYSRFKILLQIWNQDESYAQ